MNNIDIIPTWYFSVEGKTFNCCFLWTDILQQSLKSLESLWHPFVLHRGAQQLHTNSQTAICSAKKNFDSNSTSFVQNPRVWCPLLTEKMKKFWKEVENLGTDCQLNPSKNEKTECFQVSLALPEESWWPRFIGKDNWILVSCLANNKRLIEIGSEFLFCSKSVRHPSKSINQKSHSAV